jgi:hypothetical protein
MPKKLIREIGTTLLVGPRDNKDYRNGTPDGDIRVREFVQVLLREPEGCDFRRILLEDPVIQTVLQE